MRNIIPLWPLFMLLFGCEESPSEELADGSGGSPKMVGGTEICDGIDNDGDGLVDDEDPSLDGSTATTWFPDRDRDGFGAGTPFRGCDRPLPIHVRNGRDCDDRDSRVHPGGLEVCNGTDDDCDGLIDDDDPGLSTFNTHAYFLDEDGDGYGLTTEGVSACESPSGYAVEYGDCDDSDSAVSPGAIEVCNTIDDDCDGDTDDEDGDMDTATTTAWYIDYDGDGYGVETYTWLTCESPSGTVDNADDCDDVEEGINPEATEVCNDADDDCDGDTDEGVGSPSVWYLDHDGDGYGTSKFSTNECTAPSGYVDNDEDCDDLEATTNPGETEVDGDGVDNDCVNDPPSLTGVTLSADEVTTDETLVLTVTSSDPDGDDVTLKMSWTVDGIEVLTDAEELDGSVYFDRDQEVSVTVTPTDGTDAGTSETVTALVLNTPPTPPVVSVTPDEPEEGRDSLTCQVDTDATDADGDTVDYEVTWEVDGSDFGSGSGSSTWSGDTVDLSDLYSGETWSCLATPDDGTDQGEAGQSDTVTIVGTAEWHEDFSTCTSGDCGGRWVTDDASYEYVDTGSEVLVSRYRDVDEGGIHLDLESELGSPIDDERWVLRFAAWGNLTSSGGCSSMQFFAFSSTNSDHDRDSGDLISLEFQDYRAFQQYWGVTTAGDGSEVSSAALHNWMTETSPDSTWMYVEMIRESVESLTVSLYTDSDYSSLDRTESLALSSDVNGLRYLKLQSHSSTNCDTSTMVKIDDISFFNGMTEAR